MTVLFLASPIMALGGLMAWMQRVETRLVSDAKALRHRQSAVHQPRHARRARHRAATPSPVLAAAPITLALGATVVVASAVIRAAA